jgi:hypothetical protein
MIPPRSGRPHGLLRWFVLGLLIVLVTLAYWYFQQRQSLVCAAEGRGSWGLTYADGDHISKFMWVIQPADQSGFLDCLERGGYDMKEVRSSGEITAIHSSGHTISNSIGDEFVQDGRFYKW